MLKLNNSALQIQPHSDEGDGNYYREVLLPLMREDRWDEVQDHVVIELPSGNAIKFGQDNWNLKSLDPDNPTTFLFTVEGKILPYRLRNELKALMLAMMFTGRQTVSLEALRCTLNNLKPKVIGMPAIGVESFSQLTDDLLRELAELTPDLYNQDNKVSPLNKLIQYSNELPCSVNFSMQQVKNLGVQVKSHKQYMAMPPRIYTALLTQFTNDINALLPHLVQIESEINRMLDIKAKFKSYCFEKFRRGDVVRGEAFNAFGDRDVLDKVQKKFDEEGVLLVDNFEGEKVAPGRWERLINEIVPKIKDVNQYARKRVWAYEPFRVGERQFDTIPKFKEFIVEYDMKCKQLCLMLSGMRVDELHSMHPSYGAQSYVHNNQTIHLFTTRQSKITKGMQTEEDIFVTNRTGHNAFRLLTAIHRPYLARMDDDKTSFFAALGFDNFPSKVTKPVWASGLRKNMNRWIDKHLSSTITAEDEQFLRVANPKNEGIEKGNTYKYQNHQTRRSLAFYLIGLELMAFPHLKKQLSHLSSAMTRHYANNASYWGALRTEIHQERVLQKSELLANVYKRLAENGAIAGGKGKVLKKLAGDKNFFKSSVNGVDRRLSAEYWAKLIESGKEHIHAIGPGMYCTNSQCDMRINVALDECVDCEFDIILDGLYAEGKRLAAHRNLVILDEMGDLSHSLASQLIVAIKSCEKILGDLDIPFEPVVIPSHISNMLIDTVAVG